MLANAAIVYYVLQVRRRVSSPWIRLSWIYHAAKEAEERERRKRWGRRRSHREKTKSSTRSSSGLQKQTNEAKPSDLPPSSPHGVAPCYFCLFFQTLALSRGWYGFFAVNRSSRGINDGVLAWRLSWCNTGSNVSSCMLLLRGEMCADFSEITHPKGDEFPAPCVTHRVP